MLNQSREMKMNRLIELMFSNYTLFKIFCVYQVLLQTLFAPVVPWMGKIGNILIVFWAGLIAIYDFLHERQILKMGKEPLIICFLGAVVISIILNYHINLLDNLECLIVLLIIFFVFLPNYHKTLDSLQREIKWFVNGLAGIMFLCSIASLFLYLFDLPIYRYSYRFCGVFSNPNFSSIMCFLGIVASIIALIYRIEQFPKFYRFFHYLNLACCIVLFAISNSNSGKVMIAIFVGVCIFFVFYYKNENKKLMTRIIVSVFITIIGMLATLGVYQGVQFGAAYGPGFINYVQEQFLASNNPDKKPLEIEKENFDRTEAGQAADNNRFTIWKQGWAAFKVKPIFGWGPRNIENSVESVVKDPRSEIAAGGLHNMYLEILTGCGIIGFLSIILWIIPKIFLMVKFLFLTSIKNDIWKHQILALSAAIAAFLVLNLFESVMLFTTSSYSFIFWILLGFILSFMNLIKTSGDM